MAYTFTGVVSAESGAVCQGGGGGVWGEGIDDLLPKSSLICIYMYMCMCMYKFYNYYCGCELGRCGCPIFYSPTTNLATGVQSRLPVYIRLYASLYIQHNSTLLLSPFLRLSLRSLFPFLSLMLVCYTHIFYVHVCTCTLCSCTCSSTCSVESRVSGEGDGLPPLQRTARDEGPHTTTHACLMELLRGVM